MSLWTNEEEFYRLFPQCRPKAKRVTQPRLPKTSEVYAKLAPAQFNHERNDCGVRALAIAANVPYAEAHRALELCGRKPNHGTYSHQAERAFELLTLRSMERVDVHALRTEAAKGRYYCWPTITQFLKAHPKGRYFVCSQRHAFAVVDGVVHDWSSTTGSRKRIVLAFKAA